MDTQISKLMHQTFQSTKQDPNEQLSFFVKFQKKTLNMRLTTNQYDHA